MENFLFLGVPILKHIRVYQLNIKLLLTCYTLKISDVMNKCMPKFYVLKSSDAVAHIWLYYTNYFMQLLVKVHLGLLYWFLGSYFLTGFC